ncbi:MAG TPA: hypothetical protein VIP70_11500 [Nitrososphaeraceae archaeon]
MQSAASETIAAVLGTRRLPHEYERDTLSFRYQECKSCRNRTQLTCIKCSFCYSCHWKMEEVERTEFRNKLDTIYSSLSSSSKPRDDLTTAEEDDELQQPKEEEEEQETEQSQGMIVNVFGQKSEPICTYYRCHHKFSLHGLSRSSRHGCKCKHPMNKTLGVFKRYP